MIGSKKGQKKPVLTGVVEARKRHAGVIDRPRERGGVNGAVLGAQHGVRVVVRHPSVPSAVADRRLRARARRTTR